MDWVDGWLDGPDHYDQEEEGLTMGCEEQQQQPAVTAA